MHHELRSCARSNDPTCNCRDTRAGARLFAFAIACVMLASCGEKTEQSDVPTTDSTIKMVPMPMQGDRGTDVNPDNTENFEDVVYKHYAHLAVSLPVKEMDSILKSVPPDEIQEQMTKRLHMQDTIARGRLADEYHISRDSVNAILARRNVPLR